MLKSLSLYDLFILSFVQLMVVTVLVLSPARSFDTRYPWTGSRVIENMLGALAAAAVAAVCCFLTVQLWGLAPSGVQAAALPLVIFSLVVIVVRPDCSVVGKLFYASFAAAGFTFLGYAAVVAVNASRSIAETADRVVADPVRSLCVARLELRHQLHERRDVSDAPLPSAPAG